MPTARAVPTVKVYAILLAVVLVGGCAQQRPAAPAASVTPAPMPRLVQIPAWLLLQRGARFRVDVAPWSGGSNEAALMTSVDAYAGYLTGNATARSVGEPVGVEATVVSSALLQPSYGAGGALIDAYVELRGDGWRGVATVSHLVPIVPSGTHLIVEDRDIPAYDSVESRTSIGIFPAGAGVVVERIAFNTSDPNSTHSARALVTSGTFNHEVWVGEDQLAIRGMRAIGNDATSVTDECNCVFLEPIALADVDHYVGHPTDIAVVHVDVWKANAGGADLWERPRDFCSGVMTAAAAIANQRQLTANVRGRSDVVGNSRVTILGHAITTCPQTMTKTLFAHVRVNGRTGWILNSAIHPT